MVKLDGSGRVTKRNRRYLRVIEPYKSALLRDRVTGSVFKDKSKDMARDSQGVVASGGSLLNQTHYIDSGPRSERERASGTPAAGQGASRSHLGSSKLPGVTSGAGTTSGPGRLTGMPSRQPDEGTTSGPGRLTGMPRQLDGSSIRREGLDVTGAKQAGHETSRPVLRIDDTHLPENDDHETSRLENDGLTTSRPNTRLTSNLICNPGNLSDDSAGLTNNRGRIGRPVRLKFKPDRLIDSYGKLLVQGKRHPYGGA